MNKYKTYKIILDPSTTKSNEMITLFHNIYGLQLIENNDTIPIFTFGIVCNECKTDFYINLEEKYENFFFKKFSAVDNTVQFEEFEDPLNKLKLEYETNNLNVSSYQLNLKYNDKDKKLKSKDADKRFYNNVINSMNAEKETIILEMSIQSIHEDINKNKIKKIVKDDALKNVINVVDVGMKGISILLDTFVMNGQLNTKQKVEKNDNSIIDDEKNKKDLYSPRFNCTIKIISSSEDELIALENSKNLITSFTDLNETNMLVPKKINFKDIFNRKMYGVNSFLPDELSQFIHLPSKDVIAENLNISNCRKVYDKNIPKEGLIFGDFNGIPLAFPACAISTESYEKIYNQIEKVVDSLMKPRLVLGQQGTGKSEFLINLAILTAQLGISLIVVDPKNDTQQRIIESLPDEVLPRLDYINFGDLDYPPAMNLFRKRKVNDPTENSLIVSSFLSLMKKEFSRNWGIKIQRTLQMTAETILLNDIHTLNEFELMLTERAFREHMIKKLNSILSETTTGKAHIRKLIKYWENFNKSKDEMIAKDVEPVMNQLGVFLSNRVIKAIVSQQNSYDFRKAADTGRIVIINIPEGILGENAKLLSSIINKSIWLDMQSRADIHISKRYPTMWLIDEAHEIVDDEFKGVLTKARAYRLGLVLATQGTSNFNMRGMSDITETLMTNCKNKIAFRMGISDCRNFGDEFEPLGPIDLNNCPDHHFYAKILLPNGSVSNAFFGHAKLPMPIIRNYDNFLQKHRSGKFTVDQIEDEVENRLDSIKVLNELCNV